MTAKLVTFPDVGRFFQYVERTAATRADWSSLAWRPKSDDQPYAIEVTAPVGLLDEPDAHPSLLSGELVLGDLWRHARPTGRGLATPSHWLLWLSSETPEVFAYVLARAAANLRLLVLRDADGAEARAFLMCGDGGRSVADAPPPGTTAYECDEIVAQGRSTKTGLGFITALPKGWAAPTIPELLWPAPDAGIAVYALDATRRHVARSWSIAALTPIADLLAAPAPLRTAHVARPLDQVTRVPWRVARRGESTLVDGDQAELLAGRPTIFRLRTPRGRLGEALLRVLDEAESHRLPHLGYAAFAPLERPDEQWHLLIAERVEPKLLGAWNTLERFDVVPELREYGLDVFVSRQTRVIPGLDVVVTAPGDRVHALAKVRELLGEPAHDAIILIEADPDLGVADAGRPVVTHIPRDATLPLGEVIDRVIGAWHIEPLAGALGTATSAPELHPWRERSEAQLMRVVADEQAELERAADECAARLDEEASAALGELEAACIAVDQANALAERMRVALVDAEPDVETMCARLADALGTLLTPRDVWVREQTRARDDVLRGFDERLRRPIELSVTAIQLRDDLIDATRRLRVAGQALNQLGSGLDAARSDSQAAAEEARRVREAVEESIDAGERHVAEQRRITSRQLEQARARHREMVRAQDELEAERAEIVRLETTAEAIAASNETLRASLRQRRIDARVETDRVTAIRETELPQVRANVVALEKTLSALEPGRITRELADATKERDRLRERVVEAEREALALTEMQRDQRTLERRFEEERRIADTVDRELGLATQWKLKVIDDALKRITRGPTLWDRLFRR